MARRALLILAAFGVLAGYRAALLADGSLGRPHLVPGVESTVTDVARAPRGTIYVATAEAMVQLQGTPSGSPGLRSTSGSPRPGASPTSPGPPGGAGSAIGVVIAAILIGGLILMRRRLMRR